MSASLGCNGASMLFGSKAGGFSARRQRRSNRASHSGNLIN